MKLQASTSMRVENPIDSLQQMREHMREHELSPVEVDSCWQLDHGAAQGLFWVHGESIHLEVRADKIDALHDVKIMLAHFLLEVSAASAEALVWAGDGNALHYPPAFRLLTVLQVSDIASHMRRIRFSCNDLLRYDQEDNLHCKLIFPQPHDTAPQWPTVSASGLPRFPEGDKRLDIRTYTIRAIDASAAWLDIDFVLHDEAGPGSAWAGRARSGDVIGMSGPGGRRATTAPWMLLAGDETALPAMMRMVAQLPGDTRGHVFAEVQSIDDELSVHPPLHMQWHWLHRDKAAAGTTSLLQDALQALDWPESAGGRFLWIGAEFDTAQALRRWAKDMLGFEKHEQLIVAYWRKGQSEHEFKAAR